MLTNVVRSGRVRARAYACSNRVSVCRRYRVCGYTCCGMRSGVICCSYNRKRLPAVSHARHSLRNYAYHCDHDCSQSLRTLNCKYIAYSQPTTDCATVSTRAYSRACRRTVCACKHRRSDHCATVCLQLTVRKDKGL